MKMKKWKWIFVGLFLGGIVSVTCVILVERSNAKLFEQENTAFQNLQRNYDIDLAFYGEAKPPKYCDFEYRMIDKITEEALTEGFDEGVYHIVAVTDLFSPCKISDEELRVMKQFCENRGYAFVYAGDSLREQMVKCGFWSFYEESEHGFTYSGYNVSDEDLSNGYNENRYLVSNFFDKDKIGSKLVVWLHFLWSIEGRICDDLEYYPNVSID